MSEFVDCQNCGRKIFAENIECPYCGGGEEREPVAESRGRTPAGGMFGLLFNGFMVILAGVAVLALVALLRSPAGDARILLGLESAGAAVTLVGLAQRRRWARFLAILFILGNAALGIFSVVERGQGRSFAWGPGPVVMLLFLLPLLTRQARDRFDR